MPANIRAQSGGEMSIETTSADALAPLAYSVSEA